MNDDSSDPYALGRDLESNWDKIHGPAPDEVDQALCTLRDARKILTDATMMAAIKSRQAENKAAVNQDGSKKGSTDAG